MKISYIRILFLITLLTSFESFALSPEPRLSDENQEQRAMNLFLEVRCLTCQGQVIENSDSEFSYEMRQLIRRKISDGKSDENIRIELVDQFGSDILVNVGTSRSGILLWILPLAFASSGVAFLLMRKKKKPMIHHRKKHPRNH